MVFNVIITSY